MILKPGKSNYNSHTVSFGSSMSNQTLYLLVLREYRIGVYKKNK
jgi:hypothetical protein